VALIALPMERGRVRLRPSGAKLVLKERRARARNFVGEGFRRGAQIDHVGLSPEASRKLAAEPELQPVIPTEQRDVGITVGACAATLRAPSGD
jgi:hypothetical protein